MYEQLFLGSEAEQQAELVRSYGAPQPTVIGIEGGPCSGKTTLTDALQTLAASTDRPVVILPEAATQHIERLQQAGVSLDYLIKHDREGFLAFEKDVLGTIVNNIAAAKQRYRGTNAIIVADRVDIGAYVTATEYRDIQRAHVLAKAPMLSMVDQLYYLPTLARRSPTQYDELKSSNAARYESAEQAVATCQQNLRAVARHPELHVLWGGDFGQLIADGTQAILHPEKEVELKLAWHDINHVRDIMQLAKKQGDMIAVHHIKQSYHTVGQQDFRLREVTTEQGETVYYWTAKTGEGLERTELQRVISKADYELLRKTEQNGKQLQKIRYQCLVPDSSEQKKYLWSIDFYPDPALLRWDSEIALTDPDDLQDVWPFSAPHPSAGWTVSHQSAKDLATA